jgi:hypothetical protein
MSTFMFASKHVLCFLFSVFGVLNHNQMPGVYEELLARYCFFSLSAYSFVVCALE